MVEGTGGARKVRWSRTGTGKRGGVRVITYFHDESMPVFLFMLFAKNERSDLGSEDKREFSSIIGEIKTQFRKRRRS